MWRIPPELYRAIDGLIAVFVGGADDLAGLQSSAGKDDAHGLSPMIATGNGDAGLAAV